MQISPAELPWQAVYRLLIGAVLPRPIGWVSSVNPAGQPNLAPFSFFTIASANPPHVLFCPMVRTVDSQPKDTLRNIRQTGEFVVNIATRPLAEAVNLTAAELPADVDEFEFAGLSTLPSALVRPPRVALSPVHFECTLAHILDLGDQPGAGSVVVGRVVMLHIDEAVMVDGNKIDLARLQPIGRLSGSAYCQVTETFNLERPPSRLSPPIHPENR